MPHAKRTIGSQRMETAVAAAVAVAKAVTVAGAMQLSDSSYGNGHSNGSFVVNDAEAAKPDGNATAAKGWELQHVVKKIQAKD
jgi:hypothetical protein